MVRNRLAASAVVVLLCLGGVVAVGGTASAMPLPKAVGWCRAATRRHGKFAPKLTPAGTPVTVTGKTKFKGAAPTSGGCSGTAGVPNPGYDHPHYRARATFKGAGLYSGPLNANSCPVFSTTDGVGTIKMKINWIASMAIAPTKLTFTSGVLPSPSATTNTITFPSEADLHHRLVLDTTAASGSSHGVQHRRSVLGDPPCCYTFGVGSSLSV